MCVSSSRQYQSPVQHQSHNEARGSHDATPRMENLWDFTMGKPGELTHTHIRTGAIENGPFIVDLPIENGDFP